MILEAVLGLDQPIYRSDRIQVPSSFSHGYGYAVSDVVRELAAAHMAAVEYMAVVADKPHILADKPYP